MVRKHLYTWMGRSGDITPPDITGGIPPNPPIQIYIVRPVVLAAAGAAAECLSTRHPPARRQALCGGSRRRRNWGALYVHLGGWVGGFGDTTPVISGGVIAPEPPI